MLHNRTGKIFPEIPYQIAVNQFDILCSGCPFANYTVISTTSYTGNIKRFNCKNNLELALHVSRECSNTRIERTCNFNEENIPLMTVIRNNCVF